MKQPAAGCPAAGCIPKDMLFPRRGVRWDGLSHDGEVVVGQGSDRTEVGQLSNLHLSCTTQRPVAIEPQISIGTVINETLAGCGSGCPNSESGSCPFVVLF